MNNVNQKEIDEFVYKSQQKLNENHIKEGEYVVLVTADQITIHVYPSLKRFSERVKDDTK